MSADREPDEWPDDVVTGPLTHCVTIEGDVEFDLCPMGCGRGTDDVYGGPCSNCWDLA